MTGIAIITKNYTDEEEELLKGSLRGNSTLFQFLALLVTWQFALSNRYIYKSVNQHISSSRHTA